MVEAWDLALAAVRVGVWAAGWVRWWVVASETGLVGVWAEGWAVAWAGV